MSRWTTRRFGECAYSPKRREVHRDIKTRQGLMLTSRRAFRKSRNFGSRTCLVDSVFTEHDEIVGISCLRVSRSSFQKVTDRPGCKSFSRLWCRSVKDALWQFSSSQRGLNVRQFESSLMATVLSIVGSRPNLLNTGVSPDACPRPSASSAGHLVSDTEFFRGGRSHQGR